MPAIIGSSLTLYINIKLLKKWNFDMKKSHFPVLSERGYLVCTSASRPGVPGSNPIAAPKSYEVYPSPSGLLSFNKPETVLWTIANNYYYYHSSDTVL